MSSKKEEQKETKEEKEQRAILKSMTGTVDHFLGSWDRIFSGVTDVRKQYLITYPIESLLFTGVLMYLFRLGARRQINFELRDNKNSEEKFEALWGAGQVPHGDTLNYSFKRISVAEMQEVVCLLVEKLIRKKVLDRWRLWGYFLVAIDGTGELTFNQRHCQHCLTKKLNNGATLYYHPVVEAKLITANGFAFSIMTEFVENPEDLAKGDKQDCETQAFRRLAKHLKKRYPRLPICLLLDGLFADGPCMQICEDNYWKYFIVLKDNDLKNVHRSFKVAWEASKENHKHILTGKKTKLLKNIAGSIR